MFLIDEEKLLFGAAINFNDICWIYPIQLKTIVGMGLQKYNEYLSLLVGDIKEIQKEFRKKNIPEEEIPQTFFDYLLLQLRANNFLKKDNNPFLIKLEKAFFTFIQEKVHFLYDTQEILIGDDFSKRRVLNKENFEDFQNIIRAQNKLPIPELIPKNESPMARKFRLRREQVKEAKQRQSIKSGETISFNDSISTLICFNVGITFENVGNLTMYQFKDLLTRAQAKYKYELDLSMIAGGVVDPKKIKPKTWFGKIDF